MNDIPKAIELIEKSERIGIVLPDDATLDCLASAEAVSRALISRGKYVGFIMPPVAKILAAHPALFSTLLSAPSLPKEFVISVDTADSPVAELKYETRERAIEIILSPKSKPLGEKAVSFRQGRVQCDLIITVGIPDAERISAHEDISPTFFTELPVINMDVSPENRRYAEVNLVSAEKPAVSEIAYSLLARFPENPVAKETASLLLAGIVSRSEGFLSPATGAETLLAASELLRAGAAIPEARALANSVEPLSLIQLAGRASVRSRLDQNPPIFWSFLTAEDFEKTKRSPEDIPAIMTRLEREVPMEGAKALLWQDPQDLQVHAIISANPDAIQRIQSSAPGEFRSPYLKLSSVFATFRDAEAAISSLLREVLYHTMEGKNGAV